MEARLLEELDWSFKSLALLGFETKGV